MLPLETTVCIYYCSHSTVCTQVYKIVRITLVQMQLLLPVYKVTLQVTLKPAREYGLTVTVLHSFHFFGLSEWGNASVVS